MFETKEAAQLKYQHLLSMMEIQANVLEDIRNELKKQ
jgi:hypothetical protein